MGGSLMQNEYRITRSGFRLDLYKAQIRRWWFPVWLPIGESYMSPAGAEEFAKLHATSKFVQYIGRI